MASTQLEDAKLQGDDKVPVEVDTRGKTGMGDNGLVPENYSVERVEQVYR